jgi:hypothetical protein
LVDCGLPARELLKGLDLEAEPGRLFAKYNPDQPRVPAGNPGGGQWRSESAGGATLDDGVYRPGADGAPKPAQAQFIEPFIADPSILPPELYARPLVPPLPEPTEGPLPEVPTDPTVPPSSDYQWRGKGTPESGKGAYYNDKTGESLHPDFDHPGGVGPHWDWIRPDKSEYRWYLDDGRSEQKGGP